MGDEKLQQYLLQSVEGAIGPDGIPQDVLDDYVAAFVQGERRLSYLPLADLREAHELALQVRASHTKSWWI